MPQSSFPLPLYPHSGHGPHSLLPNRQPDGLLPGPLRSPHLFNAPCSRSSSPGNIAPCKPSLRACSARRTSVMAIAERLVARVSFSQKLTGPERGPSKCESQRGAPRGWKGRSEGPQAHNISPSPARRANTFEKAKVSSKHTESAALRPSRRKATPSAYPAFPFLPQNTQKAPKSSRLRGFAVFPVLRTQSIQGLTRSRGGRSRRGAGRSCRARSYSSRGSRVRSGPSCPARGRRAR